MRKLRILLDANVIVNSQIRDVFLTAAEFELIDAYWSDEILVETRRALIDKRRLAPHKADRLLAKLGQTFPSASISGYSHLLHEFDLPDPNDRHVLTAAVHGECDVLVTFNIKDFPAEAVEPQDLIALTPDNAIVLLDNDFGDRLIEVVEAMSKRRSKPDYSLEQLISAIGRDAPTGSVTLGARLELPGYKTLLEDTAVSDSPNSAQNAVWRLVEVIRSGDARALEGLVDARLATSLTGKVNPRPAAVLRAFSRALEDVTDPDEWGGGTAHRPQDPGTELVTFVRTGDDPRVFHTPAVRPAHLFSCN